MIEGTEDSVRGPEEDSQSEPGDARVQATGDSLDDAMEAILRDPNRKAALLQRIGLDIPTESESDRQVGGHSHPTSSRKSRGGCGYPPAPFWPFPPAPYCYSPEWGGVQSQARTRGPPGPHAMRASFLAPRAPPSADASEAGCSSSGYLRNEFQEVQDDEDSIDLLNEAEALELVEFDPSIDPKDSWDPPAPMVGFLEKHFNRSLEEGEREAILRDFPKPTCKAVAVPKLDEQVKEQLKRKGKDPHFGSEKTLFKIQEQVLDVTGPLTCLWADLLNKQARVTPEDTLLLIQRALVLLGSTSHSITLERRKIAWSRINPKLKSLASEEYSERESNLFGPGFLEKASKRLEVEKALDKVSGQPKPGPQPKRPRYDRDKSDLRSFLAKGASAQCGGSKTGCQNNPHSSYTRFKSRKYFRSSLPRMDASRTVEAKEKSK